MPAEDLEDLYENAPCGYVSMRHDGRIVKVNATLLDWLEMPRDAVLGKYFHEFLNVPGRIFYETHFAPLLRMQGFFHEVALDLVSRSDRRLPVLANAVERRDPDGELLFTRVTLFQAAERRRYEHELVEARALAEKHKEALAEANAALAALAERAVKEKGQAERGLLSERETARLREQFIAILGHDLRNPLASVDSGLKLLLREPQTDKAKSVIALMDASVARMNGLISDLLDLARSRLGDGIAVTLQQAELEPLVHQVLEELRAGWPDRTIEARMVALPQVQCDPTRICQLVSNLLGNALSHGADGEPVVLDVSVADGWLTLAVTNAGTPIPQSVMEHLFKPFFRGKSRGNREGLGLGLYICHEIAKAHGGTLTAACGKRDITFTFRMPLTQAGDP